MPNIERRYADCLTITHPDYRGEINIGIKFQKLNFQILIKIMNFTDNFFVVVVLLCSCF